MNTKKDFFNYIYSNNVEKVKEILHERKIDPAIYKNLAIISASANGFTEIVGLLLEDSRVDPSDRENYSAISLAAQEGFFYIVEMLLKHNKVDPTTDSNHAISYAHINGHSAVVDLLWTQLSVKMTLKKDDLDLYDMLIKKDLLIEKVMEF